MTDPSTIALYVHWPFCQAKCPYCDFNSHVSREVDHGAWSQALASEVRRAAGETPGRVLASVFFGGGTPSLMAPATVEAVLGAARAWPWANDVEITLEANPTSVEAGRFRLYRDAGVNRVSLGVQSLRDADLRALGRLHTAAEALRALEVARATFARASLDLIYARQHQTAPAWEAELSEALALGLGHLSLYQLTVEDGTAFGDRHRLGRLRGLPDEDLGADLWEVTQGLTAAAGLPAYETSNHARPGEESRHNLAYWRGADWHGIGPGAHGRLTLGGRRLATETHRAPAAWLLAAQAGRGESARTPLSEAEAEEERLLMGLRLREGTPLPPALRPRAQALAADGLVTVGEGRVALTDRGRPVLDAVLRALLA